MPLTPALRIRGYEEAHDLNQVTNSWLESYRTSPFPKHVRNELYYPFQEPLIKHLLRTSTTLMASDPEAPEVNYGWICGTHLDGVLVVHYVYVKRSWRRLGIARRLVEALRDGASEDLVIYTHRTYGSMRITHNLPGWLYHPYLLMMRFTPWSRKTDPEG